LDFGVWSDYLNIRKTLNANQPDVRGSDQRGTSVRFVFFLVALDLVRGVVVDDDKWILFAKRQMATNWWTRRKNLWFTTLRVFLIV
jgi:hypothetical protein